MAESAAPAEPANIRAFTMALPVPMNVDPLTSPLTCDPLWVPLLGYERLYALPDREEWRQLRQHGAQAWQNSPLDLQS